MNRLFKNFIIKIFFITIIIYSLLIIPNKSLAADINYQNFKNAVYNFLNTYCPCNFSLRQTQCLPNSVFQGLLCNPSSGPMKYKTDLYSAKTDDEIKNVLNKFFSEFCGTSYTSGTLAGSADLQFYCDCWNNPNPNCTNLINTIGSQVPPGASNPIGPINVSNWITNYQAGQAIGKKLQEDTSCQKDLDLSFWDFLHNPVSWLLRGIFWIFEQVMKLLADVFVWLLTPQNFGGFVNFPPVKAIWKTSRDLGNIGIILGFVLMAVATILKIEKYGWEKMLWRLVLVALLINFSLVLCGIFVDLSNFLTIYFINGAGSENLLSFKDILASTASNIACAGMNKGFLYEASSALIGIVFIVIVIGQIIGLIFYTVIRIVTLWITLGLSPLFLLSLAFPGLEKLADNWKNYFTQAIISLPIIAFSFFIVLVMLNQVANFFSSSLDAEFSVKIISLISYGIIIIVLSQAILIIAGALGVQNIQKGYQFATKLIWGGALAGIGYAWGKVSQNAVSSESWRKVAETLEKSNVTILQHWGERMKEISENARAAQNKKVEARAQKMSDDELKNEIRYYGGLGEKGLFAHRRDIAIYLNELIKRGAITEELDRYIELAKPYLNPKELKEANPQLYIRHYGETLEAEKYKKTKEELGYKDVDLSKLSKDERRKIEVEIEAKMLPEIIASINAKKYENIDWGEIFKNFEKTNLNNLIGVLKEITEKIPPDAVAKIFQSLKPAEQTHYLELLLEANREKAQALGMTPEEYLLKVKGYGSIRYFQGLIGGGTSQKQTNPSQSSSSPPPSSQSTYQPGAGQGQSTYQPPSP